MSDLTVLQDATVESPLKDTVRLSLTRETLFSMVDLMNLNRMVAADGQYRVRWSLRALEGDEYTLENSIWSLRGS